MKSFIHDIALYHVPIVITGHKQDLEIGVDLAQVVHQHGTAHPRHHHIHQKKIRPASETFKRLNRDFRTSCRGDLIAFFCQDRLEKTKDIRLVIHNQHDPANWVRTVGFRIICFFRTAQVSRTAQVGYRLKSSLERRLRPMSNCDEYYNLRCIFQVRQRR